MRGDWRKALGAPFLLASCLALVMPGPADAQGGGKRGGGGHGMQGGEGHGKNGGKKGHGGGHGRMIPGSLRQMCPPPEKADHPVYCEPAYRAASSVKGVRVSRVDPAGDRTIRVTLRELNVQHPGVERSVFVFSGTGPLAGGTVVEGGWQESQQARVALEGPGSLYEHRVLRVHVFPVTAE